jgi:hypothetical protein
MRKLYTVREIAEMLNEELGKEGIDYRYTEERVRARLRYLRSKGVQSDEDPLVKPKVLGYDRRAKYYSEEDVAKLRAIWVGPMLPEFEVRSDIAEGEAGEGNEVMVRPATIADAEAIAQTVASQQVDKADVTPVVARMLKAPSSKTFVAQDDDGNIIGWSQAEVSPSATLSRQSTTGLIRLYVPAEEIREPATQALIYRAQWWLIRQKCKQIVVEVPESLRDLHEVFNAMRLEPETSVSFLRADHF